MKIKDITDFLETLAPLSLQENYDNAGLITGDKNATATGVLLSLDITEAVVDEAIQKGCNMVVAHHPIVFVGLKKITGKNYVERVIIKAIKNDIALYAAHTNLDNVENGVNGMIASKLGLTKTKILAPKNDTLRKLFTFVPEKDAAIVRNALFEAGAGHIGHYDSCSYNVSGKGTFRGDDSTNPHVGERGKLHEEAEIKIETIYPIHKERQIIKALLEAHPYEEVAYDCMPLHNKHQGIGAGMVGDLPEPMENKAFLSFLKSSMQVEVVRHTEFISDKVQKIAVCGGAGSFLLGDAIGAGADVFITGDFKYHQFFDADKTIVIADIGHFESEQFTIDLMYNVLSKKFSNFALSKTSVHTNPIKYFV